MITTWHPSKTPRSVIGWGYQDGAPIAEPRSPSGYLLPWEAIEDHREAIANRRPDMYVIAGEFIREDGMRYPELVIASAWMEWRGYVRDGKRWRKP